MFARVRLNLKITVAYVNSMLACGVVLLAPHPTKFTEMLYRKRRGTKK